VVDETRSKNWVAESFQQIGMAALPLLCMAVSEMIDASMFIAAFVAGLAYKLVSRTKRGTVSSSARNGVSSRISLFLSFWHGRGAKLAAVPPAILALCAAQSNPWCG
jgi:NhaP-type Na+/H+ or K+/H+ antiporter